MKKLLIVDKTHGEFVKNSGTGAFVAGPDIGYQLDEAEVCGDLSDPTILRPMGLFVVVK